MGGMNLENILQITLYLGFNIDADPLFSSEVFFFGTWYLYDPYVHLFFQSAMLIIGLSAPNLTENRCDKSGDLSDSLLGISPHQRISDIFFLSSRRSFKG